MGEVVDGVLPGAEGELAYRLYRPATAGPHPVVAYFHGGGMVLGNLDSDDPFCRDLCRTADAVVVSVNYRHAPEARFPAAADDGFAAVQWIAAHAAELGGIPDQLAVAGWSAGANIAAVACQLARDAGGPDIVGQLLLTPVTDGSMSTPSYEENGLGYVLTAPLMQWFWDHYADPADRSDPKASPLRGDLSNLPPALIVTAEFDPLRDEGRAYAEALAAAGVPVQQIEGRGQIHTSLTMTDVLPSSADLRAQMGEALRGFFRACRPRLTRRPASTLPPAPSVMPSAPFAPGSVSIRLYPHNELPADAIVSELCAQAGLALDSGFDGVMTSEHHGGFAGYMAQPLQMASFVLESHATGWAAAAPLLLPLRSTALVAEEVAWLQARHPGRVGLGVAAGALPQDFTAAGVGQADAVDRFKSELPRLVAMLRGRGSGRARRGPGAAGLPTSSGPRAQRGRVRCRRRSSGPLRGGDPDGGHVDAGETRPLDPSLRRGRGHGLQGPDPPGLAGPPALRTDRQPTGRLRELRPGLELVLVTTRPSRPMSRTSWRSALPHTAREVGADALNLRVQLPGMSPEQVREQIERIGSTVVASLRKIWPAPAG